MFCYGKDDECILFPSKDECEKMDLKSFKIVPKEEIVKGLEYNTQRTVYDMDTLKLHQEQLEAELNESEQGMEIKCGTGKYLDGTFNPEDEISIVGGIYKDCNDQSSRIMIIVIIVPTFRILSFIRTYYNKGQKNI